jgi:tetratricopeptide (TPR) repeat protein
MKIGFHLIVKGEAHNIADCLNSCRGLADFIVVAVDDREDSDETFNLIKGLENVYAYRQKWENSFAAARNDSLETLLRLQPDVDYIGWIDGDDQWKLGKGSISHEEIRNRLEKQKPDAVNNTYIYAQESGNESPNLSYMRLRLFAHEHGKPPIYIWQGAAHESLMQQRATGRPTLWWTDWVLEHHRATEIDFPTKTGRNIEMLELDLRKDPNNTRTMFYLGREYKDNGQYEKSIVMLTKYVNKSKFPMEKYQALLDLGYMYLWRDDLDSAEKSAKEAISVTPEVAFAYTLLGEVYMKRNLPKLAKLQFAQAVYAPHAGVLFDYIPGRTFVPQRWLSVACQYTDDYERAVYHHTLAKKAAPVDDGTKYNDPWLIDNKEKFPEEFSWLSSFDNYFTKEITSQNEFLSEASPHFIKVIGDDEIEFKKGIIDQNKNNLTIQTYLINKQLNSTEELIEITNLIKSDKPVVILVKYFSDWGIKSIVARYLTATKNIKLYRNYELYKINPDIPQSEGLGILIRN